MKYLVAAVLGFLTLLFFYSPSSDWVIDPSPEQTLNPLRGAPTLVQHELRQSLDFSELDEPFSPDSIDTEISGQLRVDENGNLIVDEQLKGYFDYFLSSVGLVTPEQAIRRLHLLIAKNLSDEAAEQAMDVLQGYLAFKEASFDLMAEPIDTVRASSDAEYRVNQFEYAVTTLENLRREYLDPVVADAFFKEEEAFARYNLANQKIGLNTTLSREERLELRAQARSQLPQEIADIAEQQETQAQKQQDLQKMVKDGASLDDINQYVYANFSAEEAQGISEYYQQELHMKQQYTLYRQHLDSLQQQGLSTEDLQQAQSELIQQYFTADQVSMVQAWDLALVQ